MKRALTILITIFCGCICLAQTDFGGIARFSKTVHDFGDVAVDGGPVSCSFEVTNISSAPIAITSVVSSCGCTVAKWTREDIQPGKSGSIQATYDNSDGPYPFDKTLTVYVSGIRKPVILHIRGVVQEKLQDAAVSYPVHFGPLALRSNAIKAGNLTQDDSRSSEILVANIGKEPIKLRFKDISDGLSFQTDELSIAPGALSRLVFTITADRTRWGKNWYYATPVVNGKVYRSSGKPASEGEVLGVEAVVDEDNPQLGKGSCKLGFHATTIENFSWMGRAARDRAAKPKVERSTLSFKPIKAGVRVAASFKFTNVGQEPLKIYKVESGTSRVKFTNCSETVAPGEEGAVRCTINTRGLGKGEKLFIVNVYTNSPSNPVLYLYISGIIR